MGVGPVCADGFLVDDAGPDGGEGEEDADDGGRDDAEFVDVFEELEAGEEGFDTLVQQAKIVRRQGGCHVPGITMVWQPMMKMICMGPNCGMFKFRRWIMACPSLYVKMQL